MNTQQLSGKLIISRHAESEWNALGKWTGLTDINLSEKGYAEADLLGEKVKDVALDIAYCSEQKRSHQTMCRMLKTSDQQNIPQEKSGAINERDYGDLTGKNKWEVQKEIGEEAFKGIRRSWDYPVPGGETLKDVYERVLPFYKKEIVPRLLKGENVLMVAHGNSLRALIKYVEDISDDDMANVEMPLGHIIIYHVDEQGRKTDKEVRQVEVAPSKA